MLSPRPVPLPLLLGGEERLEDAAQHLRRHAGAGVGDLDHGIVARHRPRHAARRSPRRATVCGWRSSAAPPFGMASRALVARLASARLELRRIDDHRPQVGRELERDLDRLAERPAQQPRDVGDQRVRRRCAAAAAAGGGRRRAAAASGRRRAAPRRALSPPSSSTSRSGPCELAQQVEIADDDAEQVVEIVRHAAGEIADRLHLLRLASCASARLRSAISDFRLSFDC